MADSDKNILITPNSGSANDPNIIFVGSSGSVTGTVTIKAYAGSSGTLSFEGISGQLFSVDNRFDDSIFTVSDVSGIPAIDVSASLDTKIACFTGSLISMNVGGVSYTTGSVPPFPAVGTATLVFRSLASRETPSLMLFTGSEIPIQAHWGTSQVNFLKPSPGTTNYVNTYPISITGTVTARTPTSTNLSSSMKRMYIVCGASAGSTAGVYSTVQGWMRGNSTTPKQGGYMLQARVSPATGTAGSRFFCGMNPGTGAPLNSDPSTLSNYHAFIKDLADATIQFSTDDGNGPATKIDTGIPWNTTDVYDIKVWCAPGGSVCYGSIRVLGSDVLWEGSSSTTVSVASAGMSPRAYINNGTTAAAVGIDIMGFYIENDN